MSRTEMLDGTLDECVQCYCLNGMFSVKVDILGVLCYWC